MSLQDPNANNSCNSDNCPIYKSSIIGIILSMTAQMLPKIRTAADYRRGELAREVLRALLDGTDAVVMNSLELIDCFQPSGRKERDRVWNAIKYLESKHRLQIYKRGSQRFVTLTKQGELALNAGVIDELAVKKPRRWDGKWRFVMFDLPSRHPSTLRHSFRIKLEDLGFKLYQRSVFIYPYECHEQVHTIAKWYGVDAHMRYIVATEVHDMRKFAQLFDLL